MQLGALYLPLVLLFVFLLLQIFGTTFPVCKVLSSFLVKSLQPVQFWPEQAYVLHFLHRSIFLLCTNILQYLTYGCIRWQQSFQFVQFTIFSTSCSAFFAPNPVSFICSFFAGDLGWQQERRATLLPAKIPDVPFNPDQIRVANSYFCFSWFGI